MFIQHAHRFRKRGLAKIEDSERGKRSRCTPCTPYSAIDYVLDTHPQLFGRVLAFVDLSDLCILLALGSRRATRFLRSPVVRYSLSRDTLRSTAMVDAVAENACRSLTFMHESGPSVESTQQIRHINSVVSPRGSLELRLQKGSVVVRDVWTLDVHFTYAFDGGLEASLFPGCWRPDGRAFLVSIGDFILLFELRSGKEGGPTWRLRASEMEFDRVNAVTSTVHSVAWHPSLKILLLALHRSTYALFVDATTGTVAKQKFDIGPHVWSLAFSECGTHIAVQRCDDCFCPKLLLTKAEDAHKHLCNAVARTTSERWCG